MAALDEKKSAAEINQQLNSPAFKAAIEELTVEAKIDLTQFTALSNYIKTGVIDVQALNAEMLKLKTTLNNLDPSTLNFESNINARKTMLAAAQDKYGMSGDLSVVKETIDPTTQLLDSITVEGIDKLDGSLRRISLTIVDGIVEPLNNIKIAPQLTKDLKDLDVFLNSSNKEIKNLIQLDKTRGDDAQRSTQIDDLIAQNKNKILQMQTAINEAEHAGLISEETRLKLQQKITDQLTSNQNLRTNITSEIDEAAKYKEAQVALSAYQKDYAELLKLKTKEQLEPDKFTDADRDRIQYLDQRIQKNQQLYQTYQPLIDKAEQWKKAEDLSAQYRVDNAEQEKVKKSITTILKLYEDLYKARTKVETAASKGKSTADAQFEVDAIEKKIQVEQDYLSATKQSAEAQKTALAGLDQAKIASELVDERIHNQKEENAEEYTKFLESKYGQIAHTLKADTGFAQIEKDLTATSPSIQKFIKEVAGANGALRKIDNSIDSAGQQWLELDVIMNKTGDTMTVVKHSINQTTGELRRGEEQIVKNVSRSMSFVKQIGHATKKMLTWGVSARLLYGSMRQVEQGFEFIKDLDKDITQAAIVTGKQRSEVKGLANDYADLALAMGKTVKEISAVNTELLRQGLTIEESGRRLDTVIKLSATGQISTDEALKVVTTAVNAMQESHVKAADVMLRASNISASSVEQLGEAFTKTASSAYATGMSIEETTGILATMLEVTQEGPSQLGTSLKTILARFSRVNEETGEFNDELNDVQKAVESVGVSFVNADGQIRNVYDILSDLSEIWPTLDKNQQSYIATTGAGVRMQNRFFAVMNNFDRVKTITEEAGKSAGTTEKAYVTYLDSVEAASNRTQAALERFWINSINSEHISMFYDAITAIINLMDKIGALNIVIIAGMGWIVKTTGLIKTLTEVIKLWGVTTTIAEGATSGSVVAVTAVGKAFQKASQEAAEAVKTMTLGASKFKQAGVAVTSFSGSLLGTVGPALGAIAIITALTFAITHFAGEARKAKEAAEKLAEEQAKAKNTFLEQHKNYDLTIMQLDEMGKKYQEYLNIIRSKGGSAAFALGTEKYQEFINLQEEILNLAPGLQTFTDQYGNKLLTLGTNANFATEGFKNLYEENLKLFKLNFEEQFENDIKLTEEYTAAAEKLAKAKEGLLYYEESLSKVKSENYSDDQKATLLERQKLVDDAQKEFDRQFALQTKKADQLVAQYLIIHAEGLSDLQQLYLQNPVIVEWVAEFGGDLSYKEFETVMQGLVQDFQDTLPTFELHFKAGSDEIVELNKAFDEGKLSGVDYNKAITNLNKHMDDLFARARIAAKGNQALIDTINDVENAFKGSIKQTETQGFSYEQLNSMSKNAVDRTTMLVEAQKELKEQGYLSISTIEALGKAFGTATIATELANGTLDAFIEKEKKRIKVEIENTKSIITETKARIRTALLETTAYKALSEQMSSTYHGYKDLRKEVRALKSLNAAENADESVKDATSQIALLNNLLKELESINTGSGGGGGSSATKDTLVQVDAYQKINDLLQENQRLLDYNSKAIEQAKEGSIEQLEAIKAHNQLLRDRQELLKLLNIQQRAERAELVKSLQERGFIFEGEGDAIRLINAELVNTFKNKELIESIQNNIERFQALREEIPAIGLAWWDLMRDIEAGDQRIEDTIQGLVDELKSLEDGLDDISEQIKSLNDELSLAKFTHSLDTIMLSLEKFTQADELLNFKLNLFDPKDYQNQGTVLADLFQNSRAELAAYRAEWDQLSQINPRNLEEAKSLTTAMENIQQGMQKAYIATREYQRALEQLQLTSLLDNFKSANKQLELQLSIIDKNLANIQEGILPDFSVEMIMPLPDFSDIFDKTASENEKIYNEQVDHEQQIAALKQESLDQQLEAAQKFYDEEKRKLDEHYVDLLQQIATKEEELLGIQKFWDEEQKKEIETINTSIEGIITTHLSNLNTEYSSQWSNIVTTVKNSIIEINNAIANMASMPSYGGGGSATVVQAGADGKAPPGLSAGTIVQTNGGDYQITGIRPDGSYESVKLARGGTANKDTIALVGEKGYELGILPSGKIVVFGANGSELVDIPAGTQVIPHEESQEIIKYTGNINGQQIPKYADGTGTIDFKADEAVQNNTEAIENLTEVIRKPDFLVSMTEAFRHGTGQYASKEYSSVGFEGYNTYQLEREANINAISGLTELNKVLRSGDSFKDWLLGADFTDLRATEPYLKDYTLETISPQITTEIILDLIDEQLLADTVAQSLMKVDLLAQQKINNATYIEDLRLQYDSVMESGNTELAREIFTLYNEALETQMDIEEKIRAAITQRYEMEFALIEKKLFKYNQIQESMQYEIDLLNLVDPTNTEKIYELNNNIADSLALQTDYLYTVLNNLKDQQALLEVGSAGWNLINNQIDETVQKIREANLEVARLAQTIFKDFSDNAIQDVISLNQPGGSGGSTKNSDDDKYFDGLEKELEIQKLMLYVSENNLVLTQEQLELLQSEEKIRKSSLNIVQKELELQQLLTKAENLRNQKNIQQLTKKEDGTWDYEYVADYDAITAAEKDIIDARLGLLDAEKNLQKEIEDEQSKAAEGAAAAAASAVEAAIDEFNEVVKNAEARLYKTKEELIAALVETGLDFPEDWIDTYVDKYWTSFLTVAEVLFKAVYDDTQNKLQDLKNQMSFAGNEAGTAYATGLIDTITAITNGPGNVIDKQQEIIDLMVLEMVKFTVAGNTQGAAFMEGLIAGMATADYAYNFAEVGDSIIGYLSSIKESLIGEGQNSAAAFINGITDQIAAVIANTDIIDKESVIESILGSVVDYGTAGEALGNSFINSLASVFNNISDTINGNGESPIATAVTSMLTLLDEKILEFKANGDLQGAAYAGALADQLAIALTNADVTIENILTILEDYKDFDLAGLYSGEAYEGGFITGTAEAVDEAIETTSEIVQAMTDEINNFGLAGSQQGEAYKIGLVTALDAAYVAAKAKIDEIVAYATSTNASVSVDINSASGVEPAQFDTGGYTGDWANKSGKLAVLHEKEIVLNQQQSNSFKQLVNNLPKILEKIDILDRIRPSLSTQNYSQLQPVYEASAPTEQIFHINKLEFPNVKTAKDIEDAILNLPIRVKQYNKKN